ncbi:MAG: hypothetical protein OXC72_14990, partial [Roseovarius sp.]|nr:hypothetical protein [Roseovarius sp.]
GRSVGRHVVEDDVHRGSGVDPLRTPFRDVAGEGEKLLFTHAGGAAQPSGGRRPSSDAIPTGAQTA